VRETSTRYARVTILALSTSESGQHPVGPVAKAVVCTDAIHLARPHNSKTLGRSEMGQRILRLSADSATTGSAEICAALEVAVACSA
jgi:hypothetical protein